jgi:hypothetical protein
MKKRLLSIPQLLFVVGTRAALGAGVGLLAGSRLSDRKRRAAGLTLALVGAATTIPAVSNGCRCQAITDVTAGSEIRVMQGRGR